MQTPTAIDSLILKPTRESIDLVTLIPTVKAMLKLTDSLKQRRSLKRDVELEIDWLTTLDTLADTEADCKALTLAEADSRNLHRFRFSCRYRLTR